MQLEYLLANRLPRLAKNFIKLSEIVKKPNPESEAAKTTLYQKAAKLSRADTGRKRKLEAAKASASINPVVRHHHCGETSPLSRFSAQSQGIYAIQSNFSACWTHERWPTHETWRQFREWYRQNQADFLPAVEGIIPWQWSQHFMFKQRCCTFGSPTRTTCTPWVQGGCRTFVSNWMEEGLDFNGRDGVDFPLFQGSAEPFLQQSPLPSVEWSASLKDYVNDVLRAGVVHNIRKQSTPLPSRAGLAIALSRL